MRIAIDIDSTLHHYWPLLDAAAKRRFGVALPYDRQYTWAISRLREEQLRVCVEDTHSDDAITSAEPYPHAVETVNRWHDQGHFIHVTSHRAEHCHTATAQWLDHIGLQYDDLYCSYDKVARCVELGAGRLDDAHAARRSPFRTGASRRSSSGQSRPQMTSSSSQTSSFHGWRSVAATIPASSAFAMFTGLSSTRTSMLISRQRPTLS